MQRCRNLKSTNVTSAGFLSMPKKARRRMGIDSGWHVDSEQLASQLRFNPEFRQTVADEIQPGTTVVNSISLWFGNRDLIQRFSRLIEAGGMVRFRRCQVTRLSTLHR